MIFANPGAEDPGNIGTSKKVNCVMPLQSISGSLISLSVAIEPD